MNILFTCAGRRNYLINYFKKDLGGEGKVLAADMQLSAPAMVDADKSFILPSIYARDYITCLENLIKKENVTGLISLNDLELPILSKNKERLEKLGCQVIVSEMPVIDICFDKWETIEFLRESGLNYPKTYLSMEEAKKALAIGELSFPVVIKPRWGSASIGIDFPEDERELELAYELQQIRLKRTILAEASKNDLKHAILIQEKLPGVEYGMDILNDFEGNYVGTFVRRKLAMRSGETDKALSIVDSKFERMGQIIGNNLSHIGNLDCDVFEFNDKLYVLELNPRFGGGYPFSHEAGMNTVAVYIEWLKGGNDISKFNQYKEQKVFSKCDRLLEIR